MPSIQIKKSDLIDCLQQALGYACSTDWDVYVRTDGALDIRHSTYDNDGEWHEIIDLYNADLENGGKYPGDDGYDYRGSAEWIVSDCGGWLPDSIARWSRDGEVEYSIELID